MLLLLFTMACDPEDPAVTPSDWDGDGHIDAAQGGDDCNDRQPNVYPGAPTTCGDGIDNDCDGDAIEDAPYYRDEDGDRFGDDDVMERGCSAPSGYVAEGGDCDDDDPTLHPNTVWYRDIDEDGYGDDATEVTTCESPYSDSAHIGGDCDDTDPDAYPGAPAICDDGVQQDCRAADEEESCGSAVNFALRDGVVVVYGTRVDEQLGSTVAFLGDLDGDGFADFALGAPRYEAGRAFVFHGHLSGMLDTGDADAYLEEREYGMSGVGGAITALGDVDGDSQLEFAVAARGFNLEESYSSVAVYEGPLRGDIEFFDDSTHEFIPWDIDDRVGWSMDGGFDMNGDHRLDFVGGAPCRTYAAEPGRVYMLFSPFDTPWVDVGRGDVDADVQGENPNDQAGYSVAVLPDFNGDGDPDLVTGAPLGDWGGEDSGTAYVSFGPFSGVSYLADAELTLIGESAGDEAGSAVAAVGDINNDGLDDVAVGAPKRALGEDPDVGAVYLIYGRASGDRFTLYEADMRALGEGRGALAGYAIDGAGDINGDGRDDVLVGSPGLTRSGERAGGAYLMWGGVVIERLADAPWRFLGESAYDTAGYAVTGGGDWNDDGAPDLLLGAPGNDESALAAGAAYLISGQDL